MSPQEMLPRAVKPFVEFPSLLRANRFAVAPEQTVSFLTAIDLLGPRSITDIHRAAHALFAPPPERRPEFDALFRAFFMGELVVAPETSADDDDDEMRIGDDDAAVQDFPLADEVNEAGERAVGAEVLSTRRFAPLDDAIILRQFARAAPDRLPRRKGYRRMASRRGKQFDLRKSLRQMVRSDGDVITLPRVIRKPRQRSVLLLVDVSGSMKAQTDIHLRFAHVMAQAATRIEIFTFGTRLTRITRALKLKNQDQALAGVAASVADWDGGTRIGDALQAFLAVPRFAGFARGALTLVLSDGFERGETDTMEDAVRRLSRLSWRLNWLTPLASDPGFRPETAALKAVLPLIDTLGDGSSIERICAHVLAQNGWRAA